MSSNATQMAQLLDRLPMLEENCNMVLAQLSGPKSANVRHYIEALKQRTRLVEAEHNRLADDLAASPPLGGAMEARLVQAFEDALIKLVREGGFVVPAYENRLKVDPALLRSAYERIDKARVIALAVERGEEHMANAIFNSMATELATDVKKILSNTELREDVRSILRSKIRDAAATLNGATA